MRDLNYYPTLEEYRESIRSEFNPIFLDNKFYSNLIDFTVYERAPIFYTISDPSEHFAFSGAYHFETRRKRYPDKIRENLFWLHDFTHLLFPYHHDVYTVSEKEFTEAFIYQERLASTETEIFAYYRVPGLRDLVFPDETLYYDVIRSRTSYDPLSQRSTTYNPFEFGSAIRKPDAVDFYNHRNRLVTDPAYGQRKLKDYPEVLDFFQKWRTLTPQWCGKRYQSMVGKRLPSMPLRTWKANNYEGFIEHYDRDVNNYRNQDHYERLTIFNLSRAFAMLGWDDPPTKWRHVPDALEQLEGAVFFKD
jgi:hypothetical protein